MGSETPDPDDEATEQSLSLPSLGFGRRRHTDDGDVADAPTDAADTEQVAAAEDEAAEEPDTQSVRAEEAPTRVQEPVAARVAGAVRSGGSEAGGSTWADRQATQTQGMGEEPAEARDRPRRRVPTIRLTGLGRLGPSAAAAVIGAVAGLVMVGGTVLALGGCDMVRGTQTCGGGAGFGLLVVLTAVTMVLAAAMLKVAGVPYPGAISFLGVGLLALVGVVFLAETLLSPWMIVVVPAVTLVGFLLAQLFSTQFATYVDE